VTASSRSAVTWTIRFDPAGVSAVCAEGDSVADCARRNKVRIATACGGHGTCMSCTVQITGGTMPEPSKADRQAFSARRLEAGWRRACQVRPHGDCTVFVPPRSTAAPARTLVDGRARTVDLDPVVTAVRFDLAAPTIGDNRADDARLMGALRAAIVRPLDESLTCDLAVLRDLSGTLRRLGWQGQAVLRGGEVIALGPAETRMLGLAVDLGTTNVSAALVDLVSGETLAQDGRENPQTKFGSDLISYISRIHHQPSEARTFQTLAAAVIGELIEALCAEARTDRAEIVDVTVVGNTVMHHLLLGLPVVQLGSSPFIAALSDAVDVKARDLGIDVAPGAYLHLPPIIAGFIGADHVATLLATIDAADHGPTVVMDIGTNTEMSLIEGDRITSVSCPSGPAFEAGHISHGMRAAVGAIEIVRIDEGGVRCVTIGDATPVGICGSGILDAVAQMYHTGVVDHRGRIQLDRPGVREAADQRELVLVGESEDQDAAITVTQGDVRSVQLAKAAIRAGIDTLLHESGHREDELERVIIAGAFGNYIDVTSAQAVGMLPALPYSRFIQVGNAAGDGARLALLARGQRDVARAIAHRCRYVELAGTGSFMPAFSKRINFAPMRHRPNKEKTQ